MELTLELRKSWPGFTLEMDRTLSGERLGVFGPSGSGKTTLVRLLAGLEKPDCGRIILDGETLCDDSGRFIPAERRRIGLVFQQAALFPHLDVRDNLLFGYRRRPQGARPVEYDEVVAILELDELLPRTVTSLSGGERQRVALGRALLAGPRLLLLDEPLSALDDVLRLRIIHFLNRIHRELAVPWLLISHSLLEMRLLTELVLPLNKGRSQTPLVPEELARQRMGANPVGYINLLEVGRARAGDRVCHYRWGAMELAVSSASDRPANLLQLSSKEIMLFKRHPEAISARNLIACTVAGTFGAGTKLGVELSCAGGILVAEVVPAAAEELGIVPGSTVHAAIKASAFRLLADPAAVANGSPLPRP